MRLRTVPVGLVILLLSGSLAGCMSQGSGCTPAEASHGGQPVCFASGDGWVLQGEQWLPADEQRAGAPTAVLVHGLNEHRGRYATLATELAEEGWRVLAYDSRGHGESVNRTDGSTQRIDAFSRAQLTVMDRDLEAAAEWLGGAPHVVVGASIGANQALRWAVRTGTEVPLALLSPGLDYQGITTEEVNPEHDAPVLLLAAEGDQYAADSTRELAAHHGGPTTLEIVDGNAHGTQLLESPGTRDIVVAWIQGRR